MKINKDNILELKLTGKGQRPENISAKHALELLRAQEEALIAIVQQEYPHIDISGARLSLVGVKEGSTRFLALPHPKEEFLLANNLLAEGANSNNLENLPAKAIDSLQLMRKYSQYHNCSIHLSEGKRELATITPERNYEYPSSKFIKGETVIYGKIQRVGGIKPKAFVSIINNGNISIILTQPQAKKLASKLYEVVGMKGYATWLVENQSIKDFKLQEIIDYEPTSYVETFSELQDLMGEYWDEVDDINKILD